jgi:hypothetical protein
MNESTADGFWLGKISRTSPTWYLTAWHGTNDYLSILYTRWLQLASQYYLVKREQRTYRTWIFQFKVVDISFRVLRSQVLICYLTRLAISCVFVRQKKAFNMCFLTVKWPDWCEVQSPFPLGLDRPIRWAPCLGVGWKVFTQVWRKWCWLE